MNVFRYEHDGCPVFLRSHVDLYGMPYHYGFTDYLVIADDESPMVSDYKFEADRRTRPIHRYCRVERFTFILSQILGLRGAVPPLVMYHVAQCMSFNEIRQVLKKKGYQKYYNSIPSIMKLLGLPSPIKLSVTNELFHSMVNDFKRIQALYKPEEYDRKYFPSLRFIALKILQMNGANLNMLPIRTKRKLKSLEDIWIHMAS